MFLRDQFYCADCKGFYLNKENEMAEMKKKIESRWNKVFRFELLDSLQRQI